LNTLVEYVFAQCYDKFGSVLLNSNSCYKWGSLNLQKTTFLLVNELKNIDTLMIP
jgi:hypothetical protein